MQKYDYTVFIGRFQPFHAGHLSVVKEALRVSEKLIIVVGSKDKPRSPRNPFTFEERKKLIYSALDENQVGKVSIVGVHDYEYNLQKWIGEVQSVVFRESHKVWKAGPTKIALIGHSKDHTSYYLNLFPNWDKVDVPSLKTIDGTSIRKIAHSGCYDFIGRIKALHEYEDAVMRNDWYFHLNDFYGHSFDGKSIKDQMTRHSEWIKNYKNRWGDGPFLTSDALVVQSGHILLIKRGPGDGEGLWALPGGFMNPHERLSDAAIRELREETRLKVPEAVLRGSVLREKIYDDPWRSERARLVTFATLFQLKDGPLPKVKGSDDALEARWFSISEFQGMRNVMFEDHYSMITDLLGL